MARSLHPLIFLSACAALGLQVFAEPSPSPERRPRKEREGARSPEFENVRRAFDAVMDEVKNVLLTGRPDFSAAHPITMHEVFAGFGPEPEVDDRGPPEG